jgi:hypothetical protein
MFRDKDSSCVSSDYLGAVTALTALDLLRPELSPLTYRLRTSNSASRRFCRHKAGEPLKPKVGQKPADEGLFGDQAYQSDLVDLAGRLEAVKPRN